ncbi:MAG TPA: hypothetical protein VEH07_00630 [Alphaproteobacteria bacterium]|nr:hypothetical protein [Alphaproteobacteria bacterium]
MRILIAGILGGIAMFVWASLAHTVLGLGQVGVKTVTNEQALLTEIKQATGDKSGLYLFPYVSEKSSAAMSSPGASGFLVYSTGGFSMNPSTLGREASLETVQSLIAALLLAWAAIAGYWRRVGFVLFAGLAVALSTSGSYWVWYNFPTDYTLGYILTDLIRYLVAGLVLAAFLRPKGSAA